MNADWYILAILGTFVLSLTIFTEQAAQQDWLPQWLARKVLHVGAVGSCAIAPALLQDLTILTWIVTLAEPLLFFLVATGRLFTEAGGRRSWGIVLFPLSYLILLLTFSDARWLIVASMLILACSDAAAAVVGHLFARKYYNLTGDRKSIIGSLAFVISVPIVIFSLQYFYPNDFITSHISNFPFWIGLLGISLLLATLEALGSKGFDNVWIPLGAAFLLQSLITTINTNQITSLWMGITVAILFCIYTIRKKILTLNGAVVASLLGLWVIWFAGVLWLIPLFFFFITSTLWGRLLKRNFSASDVKHGKARDYVQVLCNGGLYAILATFANITTQEPIFTLMLISMAICTADTWSSEIGIYFRWRTYDIARLRIVPVGLSGGVSLPGTLGGLLGAFAIGIIGTVILYNNLKVDFIIFITIGGFIGMLLDSVLGAIVQARYQHIFSKTWSDQAGENQVLTSGWRWMTNDAVNWWSNVIGTLAAAFWLIISKFY